MITCSVLSELSGTLWTEEAELTASESEMELEQDWDLAWGMMGRLQRILLRRKRLSRGVVRLIFLVARVENLEEDLLETRDLWARRILSLAAWQFKIWALLRTMSRSDSGCSSLSSGGMWGGRLSLSLSSKRVSNSSGFGSVLQSLKNNSLLMNEK